ncbi:HD-GYP domain-containing protein [Paenibacillus sepulcri]
MRYIDMESVEPGHLLGKTIYATNGTILLSAGVQITVFMISTLKRIGVTNLYITDPRLQDIEIEEELLSEETKRTLIRTMSETMDSIRSGKDFNSRSVSLSVEDMLEDVLRNKDVLIHLNDIRTRDNAAFVHAMNVCMISALLGIHMNLNQVQQKELAIGALLHDLGKPLEESEFEFEPADDEAAKNKKMAMHHTWRGFQLLKARREFSLLIAHVALQHHEHIDGSGEPRGLAGEQIHLYSRIVAVANAYDNLLQEFDNGKRMLPHVACERLLAMSGKELDHAVVVQFMRVVSIYPNGVSVRLSTREAGVVVGQHRGLPGRPVVRLLEREGDDSIGSREIDLAKENTVFIEQVMG